MQLMGLVGGVKFGSGGLGQARVVMGLDPGSLGQVQLVLELIGPGLVGLDLKEINSGLKSGVRWKLVGFRRFQSARRISTFYILTESSRQVGHDEPIFRAIGGPEMIGDFSRERPGGVGPAVMIFDPPVRSWSSIYGRKALDE